MQLLSILKFITDHPLNRDHKARAVWRFAKWQLSTRLNPYPVIYPFTDRALLIVRKGMSGATGNLYCGLHEFADMSFLLHFLRHSDLFVDIGANIGSYTVLAAAHVGAQSISVEPVPTTFAHLSRNIAINQMTDRATALNIALGAQKGFVEFTTSLDSMNHVATATDKDKIQVPISTLDDILQDKPAPALLKIDVEGFETEVINGAKDTLTQSTLKAIIIELNNSGKRYGYDESKIHDTFIATGFEPYTYDPFRRTLTKVDTWGYHNTIYIRDFNFVYDRLQTAEKVVILGKAF